MHSRPHVYTFTGNLLAERTLEFSQWSVGKTQRARRETFQVGGKGINVSKMLTRLGVKNTALCFTGGPSGAECEQWLRTRGFNYRTFETEGSTRIGLVVRSDAHAETTFLGPDAAASREAVIACAGFLDAQPGGHILAVSGSIPGWSGAEFDPLRAAFARWQERGVLVVDTYGPPLTWFVQQAIALVKINATEFRALLGAEGSTGELLGTRAAGWPVREWVVSDGANDVWLRSASGEVESLVPPRIEEVSPTGSGDVLLAAILVSRFYQDASLREAVRDALPLAAANAAHPEIAEFPLPSPFTAR